MSDMSLPNIFGLSPIFMPSQLGGADRPFRQWSPYNAAIKDFPETSYASLDQESVESVVDLYAEGFAAGLLSAQTDLALEQESVARLAESLTLLKSEPSRDLALLLAETIDRLVRQIVGEVQIDGDMLLKRATEAAAVITDECAPARMRLHPDDHARLLGANLGVEMLSDDTLTPGSIMIDARDGWVEHGTHVGLERLRIALEQMGVPK